MALSNLDDTKQPTNSPSDFAPSGTGERKETLVSEREKVPVVERVPSKEPEPKDWLTRLETGEEVQLPQPVTDDTGQVIVDTAVPQKVVVTLPLDNKGIRAGLKHKITDSVRWLAEWCSRLIKITVGRFTYRHAD